MLLNDGEPLLPFLCSSKPIFLFASMQCSAHLCTTAHPLLMSALGFVTVPMPSRHFTMVRMGRPCLGALIVIAPGDFSFLSLREHAQLTELELTTIVGCSGADFGTCWRGLKNGAPLVS